MHPEAFVNAEKFVKKYLRADRALEIFDIGSFNINGCLKPLFFKHGATCKYCGHVESVPFGEKKCTQFNCFTDEPMKRGWCHDGCAQREMLITEQEMGAEWHYYGVELRSACTPHGDLMQPQFKRYNVDVFLDDPHVFPMKDRSADVVLSTSCLEHDDLFWLTFKEMVRILKPGGYIYLNVPSNGPYHGYPLDCWRFQADAYKALETWCPEVTLLESYTDKETTWQDNIGVFTKG